ncbi:MAG: serine/threonine protein kinase, partial [Candidatus Obscuribacter sp.]|nr:serine/threonine protein kinase [Candidatus Obscuribacter sp.]
MGEGGFSAVFESVHNVTGREVALKLLHGHLTTTEQITERFLMEARAMAKIRHDGIVQVLDAGRDPDGTIFIALELLNGESLEQTLDRVGRLTWGESLAIGIDVLTALAEAHKAKIVHRDIKPGNIFVVRKPDGGSQAKLLDFGIAQVAQAKGRLTQSGTILGTPEYMSPEQGRGVNIGPEADLWSVGIVLFECLTGTTPFAAEATTDVLVKVATERAPSLASMGVDVPTVVARAIDRAIEREVTVRYRSADEMREALQNAMREV